MTTKGSKQLQAHNNYMLITTGSNYKRMTKARACRQSGHTRDLNLMNHVLKVRRFR